jgi:hypothetical protein
MSEKRLGIVVHGTPKIGKSWLGESAPGPVLVLDGEGSTDFLKRKTRTEWKDLSQAPPTAREDGTPLGVDDFVVVRIRSWQEVITVQSWLSAGQHVFRSLVIDTLTEIQKKAKESISAQGFTDERQWGDLLQKMESMGRQWRDLLDHPTNPLWAVVVLAQTLVVDQWQRPDVQGALKRQLGSWFDVVGFLRPRFEAGQLLPTRELVVAPYPGIEAGDRTDDLTSAHVNGIIPNPDITEMIRLLNRSQ